MNQTVSELLWELKSAIGQALWSSERIRAAIAALEHTGRDVQVAFDAALVDPWRPAASSPIVTQLQPDSGGLLRLNATDLLFLQALKISAGTGAARQ